MSAIKTPTGIIYVDDPAKILTRSEYDSLSTENKYGTFYITDSTKQNLIDIVIKQKKISTTTANALEFLNTNSLKTKDTISDDELDDILNGVMTAEASQVSMQSEILDADDMIQDGNIIIDNGKTYAIKDSNGIEIAMLMLDGNNKLSIYPSHDLQNTIEIGNTNTTKINLNTTSFTINNVSLDEYILNVINR